MAPSVTLGMTFGTSNCAKQSIVKREKESLKFATENYFEIAAEAAKGNGDFLAVYGETIGCSQSSLQNFKLQMKHKHKKIFGQDEINSQKVLNQTLMMIFENQELRTACLKA